MPNQDARTQSPPAVKEPEKSGALAANLPREIASDGLIATPLEATVLFGDIVGSTERLAEIGDHRWMGLLREYYAIIRNELLSFQGHHVSTSGDGFLATFDHPGQAIQCASAI